MTVMQKFDPSQVNGNKKSLTGIISTLINLETIADYIDNLNPEGAFNRYVVRRIQESKVKHRLTKERVSRLINESWERNYKGKARGDFYAKKFVIRSLGNETMTKNAILAVAAQMGNEHGQRALREAQAYGLSDVQLAEILSHVDKNDQAFLQDAIDAIDSLWPEASALERKMNGVVPPKVEATPWQLPDGTWMKGGYFPLDFNPDLKERAYEREEKRLAESLMPAAGGRVMSKPGALHARMQSSGGFTIRADFMSTMTKHVEEISRDIAWRETIVRLAKYFRKLEPDLTAVIGKEAYRELRPYLKRIASPQRTLDTPHPWLQRLAGEARIGVGFAAMAWKLTQAMIQVSGFLPAMHKVGAVNVFNGYRNLYLTGNPFKKIDELRDLIPDLRHRAESFDQMAQQEMLRLNPVDVRLPWKSYQSIQAFSMHWGFMLLGMVDTYTATAVANGAMIQAMNGEVAGIEKNDLAAAARWAGKVVRETQGSGEQADRPSIMDDKGVVSLFTIMGTYGMTQLNQTLLAGAIAHERRGEAKAAKAAGVEYRMPHNRARFLAFYLFTFVIGPMLEETIRFALSQAKPEPPDEDDFLRNLLSTIGWGPAGGVPVLREFQGRTKGFEPKTAIGDQINAIYGVLENGTDMVTMAEDFDGEKMIRAIATSGTYVLKVPTKQMLDLYENVSQEPFGRGGNK